MARKILIAFDDSENAMRAVRYVAETFSPENEVKLFSVVLDTAAMCAMDSPELIPYFRTRQSDFCTLEDKKRSLLQEAVERAQEILKQAGFPEKNVTGTIQEKKKGVARDIAEEAKSYDLVVLGKRGLSGIEEFLLGSVSQKVLHAAKKQSVLLVS